MSTTNATTGGGFVSTLKYVQYQEVSHYQDGTCTFTSDVLQHIEQYKEKRTTLTHMSCIPSFQLRLGIVNRQWPMANR